MAFQNVSQSGLVNPTKMAVGDKYDGYLLKYVKGKVRNKEVTNMLFQNTDTGEVELVGAPGNIRYAVDDDKLEIGLLTRFTRIADKKVGGLMSSQFNIEQDDEATLTEKQITAALSTYTGKFEESTPGGGASAKELTADKIAKEAANLAAQVTRKS